ncbi:MAG: hypothetical protein L6R28_24455 [Planctomycetes bacterium]|nr:hypothetical protein [Planctomycetota bacterium]
MIKFSPRGGAIWFTDGAALPLEFDGWRVTDSNSVVNLRIEGGSLQGEIAKKPAQLACPIGTFDAATQKTISFRMKNASDGQNSTLFWHFLGEGHGTAARKLSIPIQPDSDFTEYTFDLSSEKEWKGSTMWFSVAFADGAKGSFAVDWFRVGGDGGTPAWTFDTDDTAATKLPADLKSVPVSAFTKAEDPCCRARCGTATASRPSARPRAKINATAPAATSTSTTSDASSCRTRAEAASECWTPTAMRSFPSAATATRTSAGRKAT